MAFRILDENFSDTTGINSSDTSTINESSEHEQVGEFSDMEDKIEQMYMVDPCQFELAANDSDEESSYSIDSDSEDSNQSQLLRKDW